VTSKSKGNQKMCEEIFSQILRYFIFTMRCEKEFEMSLKFLPLNPENNVLPFFHDHGEN
jgi:hypothetical protein